MARASSAESESESERIPSKKQKQREPSPDDDPMDQDGGGEGGEAADGEEEEYEIKEILDSNPDIFGDEMGFLVRWKGYPDSENSWVRESDAPNADELISAFLDRRNKEKSAKKAPAKPRKSTERSQEPKKRGRISTKSKVVSEEDELEQSPVQRTAKKQKRVSAPGKKKEPEPEGDDLEAGQFVSMEKYMHLDAWDSLITKIETIERDEDGKLCLYGLLTTGEHFKLPSTVANIKFPQKVIKFYEDNLRWKSMDDGV